MGSSNVTPVEVPTGAGDVDAYTGPVNLYGWSFRESAGVAAVATIVLRDGAAGEIIAVIELAADGDDHQWMGPQGIRCSNGITVDRVAGTTEGVVYIG